MPLSSGQAQSHTHNTFQNDLWRWNITPNQHQDMCYLSYWDKEEEREEQRDRRGWNLSPAPRIFSNLVNLWFQSAPFAVIAPLSLRSDHIDLAPSNSLGQSNYPLYPSYRSVPVYICYILKCCIYSPCKHLTSLCILLLHLNLKERGVADMALALVGSSKYEENMSLKRVKLSEQEKAWKSSLGKIVREPRSIKPQNKRGAVGGGGWKGLEEKRKLFNLTKLKPWEAHSAWDSKPKQPLRSQESPKWIPPCNAMPAKRKTRRRRRRIEDLAETDCWKEFGSAVFFF